MKARSLVASVLMVGAVSGDVASGWEERPPTVTEGRVAAAFSGDRNPLFGLARLTVGNRSIGVPPRIEPVREVCVEVLHHGRRLIDHACAGANVFVDDLSTYGEGSGTIPSVVMDEFGREVARSAISFDGRWSRDFMQGCQALDGPSPIDQPLAWRTYTSGPVFPAVEAEAGTECRAEVTFQISSQYLGAVPGEPQGMLGTYAGEHWRGPKQDL